MKWEISQQKVNFVQNPNTYYSRARCANLQTSEALNTKNPKVFCMNKMVYQHDAWWRFLVYLLKKKKDRDIQ